MAGSNIEPEDLTNSFKEPVYMEWNPTEKHKVMVNNTINTSDSATMDGEPLEEASCFKYLGALCQKMALATQKSAYGSPQPQQQRSDWKGYERATLASRPSTNRWSYPSSFTGVTLGKHWLRQEIRSTPKEAPLKLLSGAQNQRLCTEQGRKSLWTDRNPYSSGGGTVWPCHRA